MRILARFMCLIQHVLDGGDGKKTGGEGGVELTNSGNISLQPPYAATDDKIVALIGKHFDLRPKGIIVALDLLRPIYSKTAAYGHFGRDEPEFTWENTDKAAALKADAGL